MSFVRYYGGRGGGVVGGHDDCIMALAIAHYIRPQQRYTRDIPEGVRVQWTADMWEDYRNASPDERAMLEQKWGRPKR